MKLSEHFTFEELTVTSHTAFASQQKACGSVELESLKKVAQLLEIIREHFGSPVIVHSGFRCKALNTFIGGAKTSQHMVGEAADFHVEGYSLKEVFNYIKDNKSIDFAQLILEGHSPSNPSWIHISIKSSAHPNREVMTFDGNHYHKLEN